MLSTPFKPDLINLNPPPVIEFLCFLGFGIWVFPTAILAAVKPDNRGTVSPRDNGSRNPTVHQLPQTELEEQETHVLSAGLYMSAGWALSLGAIYSTAECHFDLFAVVRGVCLGVGVHCIANAPLP